jgi:hypothetical protein
MILKHPILIMKQQPNSIIDISRSLLRGRYELAYTSHNPDQNLVGVILLHLLVGLPQ